MLRDPRSRGRCGLDLSVDPEDVLEELLRRELLVPAPDQPERYRTRMAETVRLTARLRQLFTKHEGPAWRSAPRLVGDFRFAIQPRRYPTRDVAVADALATLRERLPATFRTRRCARRRRFSATAATDFALVDVPGRRGRVDPPRHRARVPRAPRW